MSFVALLSTIRNYSLSKMAIDCDTAPSSVISFANGDSRRLSPPRISKLYAQLGLTAEGNALLPGTLHLWTVQVRDTSLTALNTLLTQHPFVPEVTSQYWTITPFIYLITPQIPAEFWLFEQAEVKLRVLIRFVPDSRENPRKKQPKNITPRIKTDAQYLGSRVKWAPQTIVSQTQLAGILLSGEDYHALLSAFESQSTNGFASVVDPESKNKAKIDWDWVTQRLTIPPVEVKKWATQAHIFSTPLHVLLTQIGLTEATHLNLLRLRRDPNDLNRLVFSNQAELEQKLHANESFLYDFVIHLLKTPNRQADQHTLLSLFIEAAENPTAIASDETTFEPTQNPFYNLHAKKRRTLITTLLRLPYKTLDEREKFLSSIQEQLNSM